MNRSEQALWERASAEGRRGGLKEAADTIAREAEAQVEPLQAAALRYAASLLRERATRMGDQPGAVAGQPDIKT